MSDNKRVKMKCDIYWAQLNKKNEMSDAYQVNLCNLSDAAVKALEDIGVSVQENVEKKPEMGKYITCKSQKPIKAYDKDGLEIDSDVSIGNGSKAKVMVTAYEWSYKNKKGVSPSLAKLVVTDLIEYANNDLGDDDEDVL